MKKSGRRLLATVLVGFIVSNLLGTCFPSYADRAGGQTIIGGDISDSSLENPATISELSDSSSSETDDNEEIQSDTALAAAEATEGQLPTAFRQEYDDDSAYILVTAPEGAFPDGTQLNIEKADPANLLDALKDASGMDITAEDVLAYDFDFFTQENQKVEPDNGVTIVFSDLGDFMPDGEALENDVNDNDTATDQTDYVVYHVDEDGTNADRVETTVDYENHTIACVLDAFSPVAIVRQAETAGVTEGTWTMQYADYPAPGIIGQFACIPDPETREITSTAADYDLVAYYYQACGVSYDYENNTIVPLDTPTQFFDYQFRTKTLVNWAITVDQDYTSYKSTNGKEFRQYYNGLILPSFALFRQGGGPRFGMELVEWGQSQGLDWTLETEITDFKADFKNVVSFTDEDGNPADFLRYYNSAC